MENVIYLEVDSEITEAIEKLKGAKGHTVKLVVPARSSLLQSVVNVKLLKKAATDGSKELALVTSDKTAKHIAARIGIPVAANVRAEPKVPDLPEEGAEPDIDEAKEAKAAAEAATEAEPEAGEKADKEPVMATREIGEEEPTADKNKKPAKAKKSKNKIPDFNSFQKKLFIGIGVAVGLIAIILLLNFLPVAKIVISAQADKKTVNFQFTADAGATTSDPASATLAAKQFTEGKDYSTAVSATGKKDVGTKATGSLSIKNCEDSNPRGLPAGTVMSASGKNFTTNGPVTVPGGSFAGGGSVCNSAAVSVVVTASDNGDSYNLSNASFTSPTLTANFRITGTTAGGTSKVVNVVAQSDVDGAKKQLIDSNHDKALQDLQDKAGKNTTVFGETFTQTPAPAASSVPVGSEGSTTTVNVHVDYSLLGADNATLDDLFNAQIKKDLNANTDIYQNGRAEAQFTLVKQVDQNTATLAAKSTAYVGSKIDKVALSHQVAGKSKKQVEAIVKQSTPAAQSVQVNGVPFWPWTPVLASHNHIDISVVTN